MRRTTLLSVVAMSALGLGTAGCSCSYQVGATQPPTFGPRGGSGSFTVTTNRSSCKWNADEDSQAEDWVKVAGGTITGTGSMNFNVLSGTAQPNVPLPRSGYIQIFEEGSNATAKTKVQVTQTQ